MADVDRMAAQASDSIKRTLTRLGNAVSGLVLITVIVGVATFSTGMWVFDGSAGWIVVGGVASFLPAAFAITAWVLVATTRRAAPRLLSELNQLFHSGTSAATALIDHDTGLTINRSSHSLGGLQRELLDRKTELPALFAGVRAIVSVPWLAMMALLGFLAVGALGTLLLLVGLL